MLFFRVVILTFLLYCTSNAAPHDDVNDLENGQLIFAHVLYRHGHRNANKYPVNVYPNDPYADESHWPGGFGQLTNEGKRQQFELGQFFRRRYNKLLGDKYSPKKVYVHSSDKDRTLMSALANLAGLFPPTASETWHENIPWQPIPVHTIPLKLDYAMRPGDCPRYSAAYKQYESESPELQQIFEENADNILYWSKMCGSNLSTIAELFFLYDALLIQSLHNKTIADWARKAIEPNGALELIVGFGHKMSTNTKELARLRSGFLIKEIFEHFAHKINSTLVPDRSLWLYTAHDSTIVSLLNTLGLFELHQPPFCASVHLELYKVDEKEHYIQIFYRKSDEEILLPMKIPNCGEKCSLSQLYQLYNDVIPNRDHDTECRQSI